MKKIIVNLILGVFILNCISCNHQNGDKGKIIKIIAVKSDPIQVSFNDGDKATTYIKGKVHNWISDTIYLTTLTYYSPYSNVTYYQTLSKDSTFKFNFHNIDNPIIFQLAPTKAAIDGNINSLLFDNLTDKHYFGQCEKFNTYLLTTYLLEPNDSIIVKINFNSWIEKLSEKKAKYLKSLGVTVLDNNTVRDYGKTGLTFLNPNKSSLEFYQNWFAVDDMFDSQIERSKNIEIAYNKVKQLKEKLISDLNKEKSNVSPFLYEHLRTYIEFGARKEFLKNLILVENDYLKGQVKDEIRDFLEFNKDDISFAILSCDQYNDYLEFYLTYKMNMETGNNLKYYAFNKDKFKFASKELPEKSQYYYLANHILHQENSIDSEGLSIQLIEKYPKGDLNVKLKEKYQ